MISGERFICVQTVNLKIENHLKKSYFVYGKKLLQILLIYFVSVALLMYLSLSQHSLNPAVFSVSAKMKHRDCSGAPKDRCGHSVKGTFHY